MGRSGILSRLRGRPRRSSTPSSSVLEKIRQAAKEAKLDDLSKDIAEYFELIKQEKGTRSPGSAAKCRWPHSESLTSVREVMRGVAETCKDFFPDAKTIAQAFLQGMGGLHMLAAGFLVAGYFMERYETMLSNKEECLCLLERMNDLIQEVKQLKERRGLMKATEAAIKEAMELIIEVSLACCVQIDRGKFRKFFSTTVNKKELQGFQTRLTELHRKIGWGMDLAMYDLQIEFPVCPGRDEKFRRENKVQIDSITQQLQWETEERAVAVILYGLGGTGKTALADAVYWRLYHEEGLNYKYSYVRLFDPMILVPDIKKLQTQILQDLTLRRHGIRTHEQGQGAILEVLQKDAVFIYIDNVLFPGKAEGGGDAIEQLLPRTTKKVKKLRLLITTRDKGAAAKKCNKLGIKPELYPIKILEDTKAMQLVTEELNDGEEDLVNEQLNHDQINQIVQICGGIPRVLKEVAAYIRVSQNREEAQQRYHHVISESKNKWNGRVGWNNIARYAFAHDLLDEKLKDLLFDICSYFEGWQWDELSNMVGDNELERLEDRALVTRDVKSRTAKVHIVILAIGIHNKGSRFKFTSKIDASKFQKDLDRKENKDLCDIKGIWSDDNIGPLNIPASKLDLMCGSLRVLALGNSTKVNGQCKEIFKKLFFFSAEISYLPVALGQMPYNLISNLRVLRLRKPQQVHLRQCRSIESLPESNGQSNLFNSINLSSTDLKELPDGFCSLSSLTEITMDSCRRLENLPDRFGEVRSLRKLSLSDCVSLKKLPDSFSQLEYLEDLNLSGCEKLKKLPENFHGLPSLKHLYLSDCVELEVRSMESIVKMETLQIVDIQRSPLLQEAWQNIEQDCNQWSHKVVRTSGQGSSNEESVERNDDMPE